MTLWYFNTGLHTTTRSYCSWKFYLQLNITTFNRTELTFSAVVLLFILCLFSVTMDFTYHTIWQQSIIASIYFLGISSSPMNWVNKLFCSNNLIAKNNQWNSISVSHESIHPLCFLLWRLCAILRFKYSLHQKRRKFSPFALLQNIFLCDISGIGTKKMQNTPFWKTIWIYIIRGTVF